MSVMNLKISVIVPVYKVEQYLNQCLDSIVSQSYKNLEIILVDDGSPDNCGLICDQYALLDSRITVIHQINQGQSAARNNALDVASGEIIAFVDSDDWLDADAFKLLMGFMISKNLDAVFMGANIIEDGKVTRVINTYFPDGTIPPSEVVRLSLTDEIGGQPGWRICRKHLWKNVRFPEGRIYEDLAISFLPFINATQPVGFLNKPLYNYRMNMNGTCLSYNPQKTYHIFLAFREHLSYALQHSDENVIGICLRKTTRTALGTINVSLTNNWKMKEHDVNDAADFLKCNKNLIIKSGNIRIRDKILVSLFNFSPTVYFFLGRMCKKIFPGVVKIKNLLKGKVNKKQHAK